MNKIIDTLFIQLCLRVAIASVTDTTTRILPNQTAIEGQQTSVHCKIEKFSGFSTFWYKGSKEIIESHRFIKHKRTLTFTEVDASDEGWYTCTSQVDQKISGRLYLTVHVSPVIDSFSFQNNRKVGDRLDAMCVISKGDLPVHIDWLKDGQLIQSNNDISIMKLGQYKSILSISSLSLSHRGNYTCRATNNVGSHQHTAYLSVNVPPYWITEPHDNDIVLRSSSWIDCHNGGSPTPTVVWKKINSNGKTSISNSTDHLVYNNGTLFILNVSREDRGSYMCLADNSVGVGISKIISLTVRVPPSIRYLSSSITIRQHHKLDLHCEATGDLPISIQWVQSKTLLNPVKNNRFIISESTKGHVTSSRLKIDKASASESAIFSCVANNRYGRVTRIVRVTVLLPPDIPVMWAVARNRSSLTCGWASPRHDGGSPLTGYILRYKKRTSETWHSLRISAHSKRHTMSYLSCGTVYAVSIAAVNDIGQSQFSRWSSVRTYGKRPKKPKNSALVKSINSTFVYLNLSSWQPQGCGIEKFSLCFRVSNVDESSWNDKIFDILPNQTTYLLSSLSPATRYEINITAFSEGGNTESIIEFVTAPYAGEIRQPRITYEKYASRYTLIAILIPSILGCILVSIILSFIFLSWRRNRKLARQTQEGSSDNIISSSPQGDLRYTLKSSTTNYGTSTDTLSTVTNRDTPRSYSTPASKGSDAIDDEAYMIQSCLSPPTYSASSPTNMFPVGSCELYNFKQITERQSSSSSLSLYNEDVTYNQGAVAYSYTDVTKNDFTQIDSPFVEFNCPKPHKQDPMYAITGSRWPRDDVLCVNTNFPSPTDLSSGPLFSKCNEVILSPVLYATSETINTMFTSQTDGKPPAHIPAALPSNQDYQGRQNTMSSVTTVSSSLEELTQAFERINEPIYHTLIPLNNADDGTFSRFYLSTPESRSQTNDNDSNISNLPSYRQDIFNNDIFKRENSFPRDENVGVFPTVPSNRDAGSTLDQYSDESFNRTGSVSDLSSFIEGDSFNLNDYEHSSRNESCSMNKSDSGIALFSYSPMYPSNYKKRSCRKSHPGSFTTSPPDENSLSTVFPPRAQGLAENWEPFQGLGCHRRNYVFESDEDQQLNPEVLKGEVVPLFYARNPVM